MFDVTESGEAPNKNYAYTVNTQYKATLASVLGIGADSKDEDFAAKVAELGKDNSDEVQNFANAFTTKALEGKLEATATSGKITEDSNKTSYTFNNLTVKLLSCICNRWKRDSVFFSYSRFTNKYSKLKNRSTKH